MFQWKNYQNLPIFIDEIALVVIFSDFATILSRVVWILSVECWPFFQVSVCWTLLNDSDLLHRTSFESFMVTHSPVTVFFLSQSIPTYPRYFLAWNWNFLCTFFLNIVLGIVTTLYFPESNITFLSVSFWCVVSLSLPLFTSWVPNTFFMGPLYDIPERFMGRAAFWSENWWNPWKRDRLVVKYSAK